MRDLELTWEGIPLDVTEGPAVRVARGRLRSAVFTLEAGHRLAHG